MLPSESAPLLYRELARITTHAGWSPKEQVLALAGLMERIFFEATRQEQIAFSTLFARISYAGHKFLFGENTLRTIHRFRLAAKWVRNSNPANEQTVQLGLRAVAEAVLVLTGAAIPQELIELLGEARPDTGSIYKEGELTFAAVIRVVALEDSPEDNCFIANDEDNPERRVRVRYGLPDRNENFMPTIQVIRKVFGFPVTLNLLDVDIDVSGDYRPRAFVVEPDYLVDVSAIAECFKDTGAEPYSYLVRKFLPIETTEPKLLGNIANSFLDRLLNEPDAEWATVFRETFQLFPFIYAPMTDAQVKSVSGKAQKHFLNLKNMVISGLAKEGIEPENCFLEPAFFSEKYGIQGRLDLFYRTEEKSAIVELKSGTPFKPNSYGIQRSHFTQTLLYDLLVRSVYGRSLDPAKYILYSGADMNHLRFAPTIAPEQWEALQVRNQLVALERLLTRIQPGDETVPAFGRLRAAYGKGFTERDFARFEAAYSGLSILEKKYFNAFTGFIAREHWLAKVGEETSDSSNGHAARWRSSFEDKQQNFSILSHLEILENHADQPEPYIVFQKTDHTNPLANFRVGDIAVLYPAVEETDTVMHHQVIKCTITELSKDRVTIQLRFRQHNLKPFHTRGQWRLEPDLMDTGFAAMYRGLLEWAEAGREKRELLLGLAPPGRPTQSQNYFLLWGPPGTGKTSVMLRDLAAQILNESADNLLLLAYTNRAVDEICEALDSIGGDIRSQYLRIGARYSTAEPYRPQLLNAQIAGVKNRAGLRAVIESRRIFVSTVASFSQNEGLLKIKKFQRLIVDEASQILEPHLIGLLTRFDHFTLIGDHRQLPAVTTQREETTAVRDADLNGIGLTDLRDSYFERLYRRCVEQGWHWAYGQLDRQGRMHTEIMEFPNLHFYGGKLRTLSDDAEHSQCRTLAYASTPGFDPAFEKILSGRRVVFIPAAPEEMSPHQKTSRVEAEITARIVLFFKKLWEKNGKTWHTAKTLGIITPWRAQIAQIRESLSAAGLDPDEITIDTVERYQGGAREIIVVSTCVHSEYQLASLVNLSGEGVDRKMNVALTRAREHLIMLGNEEILQKDARYRAFIEQYKIEPVI
ncbi:MAG: DNA helicase [Haliscomenobacteraceae bacterium CHB4]|nr:DNA helicase [Haliscomenobacteraceae bacterium CHB4]